MSRSDEILCLITENGAITQDEIAKAIYGDNSHRPAVYGALMKLVDEGTIMRTGERPAFYSFDGKDPWKE